MTSPAFLPAVVLWSLLAAYLVGVLLEIAAESPRGPAFDPMGFALLLGPLFGAYPRGLSLNEGGRFVTLCALAWRQPAWDDERAAMGVERRGLVRLWVFGVTVFEWSPRLTIRPTFYGGQSGSVLDY